MLYISKNAPLIWLGLQDTEQASTYFCNNNIYAIKETWRIHWEKSEIKLFIKLTHTHIKDSCSPDKTVFLNSFQFFNLFFSTFSRVAR